MKSAKSLLWVILSGALILLMNHSAAIAFEFPRNPQTSDYSSEEINKPSIRKIRMRYSPEEQRNQETGSALGATRRNTQGFGESDAEHGVQAENRWDFNSFPSSSASVRSERARTSFHNKRLPGDGWGEAFHAIASWYGGEFHGRLTASGEAYNMHGRTAAHRTLPFGTRLRVTNLRNGRQTVVRVNDRGPFVSGRDIDLSYQAARDLQMVGTGVERVELEIIPG